MLKIHHRFSSIQRHANSYSLQIGCHMNLNLTLSFHESLLVYVYGASVQTSNQKVIVSTTVETMDFFAVYVCVTDLS